jgi:hypothetical protein
MEPKGSLRLLAAKNVLKWLFYNNIFIAAAWKEVLPPLLSPSCVPRPVW